MKENKPAPPKKEAPTVLISKNQAIKIALAQLKGEVDDVEFVQTSDGGHYLVEIEVDDEDDERGDGAVYQIHAITGKVVSCYMGRLISHQFLIILYHFLS